MMTEKTWKERHDYIKEITLELEKVGAFLTLMPHASMPESLNNKLRGFVETINRAEEVLDYFSLNIEFEHLAKEER